MDAAPPVPHNTKGASRCLKAGQICLAVVMRGAGYNDEASSKPGVLTPIGTRSAAGAAAPERSDLEPEHVRHLLGDIFVLSYDRLHRLPVSGGRNPHVRPARPRSEGTELHRPVPQGRSRGNAGHSRCRGRGNAATVAGLTTQAADGTLVHLELLLLPFSARSHSPVSLTGLLAPLDPVEGLHAYGDPERLQPHILASSARGKAWTPRAAETGRLSAA